MALTFALASGANRVSLRNWSRRITSSARGESPRVILKAIILKGWGFGATPSHSPPGAMARSKVTHKRHRSNDLGSVGSTQGILFVKGKRDFDACLTEAHRANKLVIVLWTAEWFRLHAVAIAALAEIAQGRTLVAKYLVCDADKLSELAADFAVHDLPSFHIFHNSSLVERLSGFRSAETLPSRIDKHVQLANTGIQGSSLRRLDVGACPAGRSAEWLTSTSTSSYRLLSAGPPTTSGEVVLEPLQGESISLATSAKRSYLPRYYRPERCSAASNFGHSEKPPSILEQVLLLGQKHLFVTVM